ncbi:DEKNAAC100790 [Brettanomyces naardenensis]|uniref:DEKNAAC100790 n=1 Tax=Brettanomyces naardenensis TaxID=13370 RepID=A0A448YEN9_BRENA|nr:DEKNAAC100790 [Brettanomyces naardenensis]
MENSVSTTASAILNILASIRISSSDSEDGVTETDSRSLGSQISSHRALRAGRHVPHNSCPHYRHNVRHSKTAPKSIVSKRRLSNSSDNSNRGLVPDHEMNGNETAPTDTDHAYCVSTSNRLRSTQGHKIKRLGASHQKGRNRTFCDPFDRDLLIERIETFNVLNWTVNDSRLTPLECATNGWSCHSKRKNELRCQGCHATILVRLNGLSSNQAKTNRNMSLLSNFLFESDIEEEEEEADFRRALVTSYVNRLHTDHYQGCIWRADNLVLGLVKKEYYLSIGDMDRILPRFEKNLEFLGHHQQFLSLKNFRKDIISSADLSALKEYTQGLFSSSILLLVLLGWELKQQRFGKKTLVLLNCPNCTRRILLGEVSGSTSLDGVHRLSSCSYPPSTVYNGDDNQRPKSSYEVITNNSNCIDEFGDDEVNLINEHERWCCMVGRYSPTDLPGYKIVLRLLESNTFDVDMLQDDESASEFSFDDSIAKLRSL